MNRACSSALACAKAPRVGRPRAAAGPRPIPPRSPAAQTRTTFSGVVSSPTFAPSPSPSAGIGDCPGRSVRTVHRAGSVLSRSASTPASISDDLPHPDGPTRHSNALRREPVLDLPDLLRPGRRIALRRFSRTPPCPGTGTVESCRRPPPGARTRRSTSPSQLVSRTSIACLWARAAIGSGSSVACGIERVSRAGQGSRRRSNCEGGR